MDAEAEPVEETEEAEENEPGRAAYRPVAGSDGGRWTARSTPRMGAIFASVQAWTNRTAP
ncbi:MAG: hypothetical protein BWY91_00694 [bacterium ADurb.BinA028]|nr:MAG: hypothetical protein BWY91_00694 [bacterium ADurb.BinA028]